MLFENHGSEPSSLIVISIKNKEKLQKAYESLKSTCTDIDIDFVQFFEPSWDYGLTAFASSPVPQEQRNLFKKYQLFKGAK